MVNLDLDVKSLVGLGENERITQSDFKKYLNEFTKDNLINYIVSEVYDNSDNNDELDEEDY